MRTPPPDGDGEVVVEVAGAGRPRLETEHLQEEAWRGRVTHEFLPPTMGPETGASPVWELLHGRELQAHGLAHCAGLPRVQGEGGQPPDVGAVNGLG